MGKSAESKENTGEPEAIKGDIRPGFKGANVVQSRLNDGGDTAFKGKRTIKGKSHKAMDY